MHGVTANLAQALMDAALLASAIILLFYAHGRDYQNRSIYPPASRILLFAGAGIYVLVFVIDSLIPGVMTFLQAGPGAVSVPHPLPDWLYWTLTRFAIGVFLTGLFIGSRWRLKIEGAYVSSQQEVQNARGVIARSEGRFRALLETTSNGIFCYSVDPAIPIDLPAEEQLQRVQAATLVECNEAFVRMLGWEDSEEILGTSAGLRNVDEHTELYTELFATFVENDYRVNDYEINYRTRSGEERSLRCSLTGIVEDGQLLRFWGAVSNEIRFRMARAALARRRDFQRLLGSISSRFVLSPFDRADAAMRDSMIEACRFVGADRTSLLWFNPDDGVVEIAHAYTATGETFGAPLSLDTFPAIVAKLEEQHVVAITDVHALPDTHVAERARLGERGIRSLLALPINVDDQAVGVATYAMTDTVREWSEQEILDLQVLAGLFGNFTQRIRSRRALDEALERLEKMSDRLAAENVYLQEELSDTHKFHEIIGRSDAMQRCFRQVAQVAKTQAPVLIVGETGTGKELVARAIHAHSDRADRPLVKVNCAALPATLIESELFGYEKGAFTGADAKKRGRFEVADGSTLFLDEIGEIPLELQPKLLRALQEGEIEPLGSTSAKSVDVRIIAATNKDLWRAVNANEFRSDLFFRVNAFPIALPPLRDRGDDIQLLAEFFRKRHAKEVAREFQGISAGMMRQLLEYEWPGNVRELEGVIQRAVITSPGALLELAEPLLAEAPEAPLPRSEPRVISTTISELKLVERDHIIAALEASDWKISGAAGAASRLGLPPSTLRSKMKKLSIERPD